MLFKRFLEFLNLKYQLISPNYPYYTNLGWFETLFPIFNFHKLSHGSAQADIQKLEKSPFWGLTLNFPLIPQGWNCTSKRFMATSIYIQNLSCSNKKDNFLWAWLKPDFRGPKGLPCQIYHHIIGGKPVYKHATFGTKNFEKYFFNYLGPIGPILAF